MTMVMIVADTGMTLMAAAVVMAETMTVAVGTTEKTAAMVMIEKAAAKGGVSATLLTQGENST
jgi:hypothetical protein